MNFTVVTPRLLLNEYLELFIYGWSAADPVTAYKDFLKVKKLKFLLSQAFLLYKSGILYVID